MVQLAFIVWYGAGIPNLSCDSELGIGGDNFW